MPGSEGDTPGRPVGALDDSRDAAPGSVHNFEATEAGEEFKVRLAGRGVLVVLLASAASCLLNLACMLLVG